MLENNMARLVSLCSSKHQTPSSSFGLISNEVQLFKETVFLLHFL